MSEQISMRTRARILVAREMVPLDPKIANVLGPLESIIIGMVIARQGWSQHWVELTREEIQAATGISPKVQARLFKELEASKLIHIKSRRLTHQTWYMVRDDDFLEIDRRIADLYPKEETSENPNDFPNRPTGVSGNAEIDQNDQNDAKTPMISPTDQREFRRARASEPEPLVVAVPGACTETREGTRKGVQGKTLETESEYRPDGLTDSEDSESDSLPENFEASEREETDSENESDSATEIPPEKSAPPPPPPEGPRRAPRMPPPRPQAPEPPRTRREVDRLLRPTEDVKTLPPKPQKQCDGVKASGLTLETVAQAWNEMAVKNGLPKVMVETKDRVRAFGARKKDAFWVANWRAALDQVPEADWRMGRTDRKYLATIEYFLRPDTVAKLMEEQATGPATAKPPQTAGRSSKCPYPPGSPEWEKWYLANG